MTKLSVRQVEEHGWGALIESGKFEEEKALLTIGISNRMESINPKNEIEVLESETPTLATLNKYRKFQLTKILVSSLIASLVEFLNIGKTMNNVQIGITAELIIETYPMLTVADLKLFFKKIMKGEYGELYDRLDGQSILICLKKYFDDRCNIAFSENRKKDAERKNEKHNEVEIPDFFQKFIDKRNKKHPVKENDNSEFEPDKLIIEQLKRDYEFTSKEIPFEIWMKQKFNQLKK